MPASPPKTRSRAAPIAYAGEISRPSVSRPACFITTNWIGNLAIGITAVSYLSTFFPALNNCGTCRHRLYRHRVIFTFVNMGGTWVSRLTTLGLVPVIVTATLGWHWFDAYQASGILGTTDSHAVIKSPAVACGRLSVWNPQRSAPAW